PGRGDRADQAAEHDSGEDRPIAQNLAVEQGRHDGEEHSDGGEEVSVPRRFRGAELLDPDDEQDGGDQVDDAYGVRRKMREGHVSVRPGSWPRTSGASGR